ARPELDAADPLADRGASPREPGLVAALVELALEQVERPHGPGSFTSGSVCGAFGGFSSSPASSMRRGSTSPTASFTSRMLVPRRRATCGTPFAPNSSASTASRITTSQTPNPNGTAPSYGTARVRRIAAGAGHSLG